MPRRIKKHLINTRRRKHHGGGKKKGGKTLKKVGGSGNTRQRKHYGGSKKRRTTKRKVGGRSCSSLVNNKQGGKSTHDNHGPVVEGVVVKEGDVFDVENFAKSSVLPPPTEENEEPAMGVIVPADADAARADAARAEASRIKAAAEASSIKAEAEEAANFDAEDDRGSVMGVVVVDNYDILIENLINSNKDNQIKHIYEKYLAPIEDSPWNSPIGYKWNNTQLFWDFIKQEIINYGEISKKNKSLRNFVEECLYRWNWKKKNCENPVIEKEHPWAEEWWAFDYEAVIKRILGGKATGTWSSIEEDDAESSSKLSDEADEDDFTGVKDPKILAFLRRQPPSRREANRPKFDDEADLKINQPEWRNYVRVNPEDNVEQEYWYHIKVDSHEEEQPNVIKFDDEMKRAEYRLWLIFKACFEEYHKKLNKMNSVTRYLGRRKGVLHNLFANEADPPPRESPAERRTRKEGWRKTGEVMKNFGSLAGQRT